ncbi:MAG: spore germination protein GerPC [Alicyclobacillus herbarius]|uniref:spore germination protein GerPC n=1 Tax=Alicyclobacillus herbarius TaxID=122960 RepID=UPI0023549917|nr:spore germination protein GerPC [Alicyclobacillus herbarius]MCL6631025.1 spore germination protein GerPC [Alicyclobacillus herbarius]
MTSSGPQNLDELVAQVQWLWERVYALEAELAWWRQNASIRVHKLEYHIDKLAVRDLSGTLTIGIAGGRMVWPPGGQLRQVSDGWPEAEVDDDF